MATTKYQGDLKGYKTKYLRCRGRKRHPWRSKGHYNIIEKNGKIMQFTEELQCANACGVRRIQEFEVVEGRFVPLGKPELDYSGAPGYLMDKDNLYEYDEARDELMLRELMANLQGPAFDALLRTRNITAEQVPARHLKAV